MTPAELLMVIFLFGLCMCFLVAKGVWESRDYHARLKGRNAGPTAPRLTLKQREGV